MGWPGIDIVVETSWFKECCVAGCELLGVDYQKGISLCSRSLLLHLFAPREQTALLGRHQTRHHICYSRTSSLSFLFTDVNEKSKIVAIREWLCIDQRDPESRADRWSRRAFAGEYYLSENAVFSLCLTCKSNFTFEKSVERVCRYCESPYCYCVYVLGKWCRCIGFSLLWLLCRKLFELQQLGYQRYEEKSRSVPVGEMFCSHYTACIWTSQSKTGSYLDLIWR